MPTKIMHNTMACPQNWCRRTSQCGCLVFQCPLTFMSSSKRHICDGLVSNMTNLSNMFIENKRSKLNIVDLLKQEHEMIPEDCFLAFPSNCCSFSEQSCGLLENICIQCRRLMKRISQTQSLQQHVSIPFSSRQWNFLCL